MRFRRSRRSIRYARSAIVETCENRLLLAGNIRVSVVGNSMKVTGDAEANAIAIDGASGRLIVTGEENTLINGQSGSFTAPEGIRSLSAFLRQGADSLTIRDVSLPGRLKISAGDGADSVTLHDVSVVKGLRISGGDGDDSIGLERLQVTRDLRIGSGDGDDLVAVSDATIGRNLFWTGHDGNDSLIVSASFVAQDTWIAARRGDDNVAVIESVVADDFRFWGDRGDDVVLFDSSQVGDKSWIFGGAGNDSLIVDGTAQFFDRTRFFGGSGNDAVQIADSVILDGLRRRRTESVVAPDAHRERISGFDGALDRADQLISLLEQRLRLSVSTDQVTEGGSAQVEVTLREAEATERQITFGTEPGDARVSLSESVLTIPAGSTAASATLNVIDDALFTGSESIDLTAVSEGLTAATISLTVLDDEMGVLAVTTSPTQLFEDTGTADTLGTPNLLDVTLTRTGDTSSPLTVDLEATLDGQLNLPESVLFEAGQSEVTLSVPTVPDLMSEGKTDVTVRVTANQYVPGEAVVTLVDTEVPSLLAILSEDVLFEDGGSGSQEAAVRIERTDVSRTVTVLLTADPSSAVFLATPRFDIPAGASGAAVTIRTVDNDAATGDRNVVLTAVADGLQAAQATIRVVDDD